MLDNTDTMGESPAWAYSEIIPEHEGKVLFEVIELFSTSKPSQWALYDQYVQLTVGRAEDRR